MRGRGRTALDELGESSKGPKSKNKASVMAASSAHRRCIQNCNRNDMPLEKVEI